ncbi:hypothetical protein HYW94_00240 [Candidatus Uhrbacteria bacterium]|nr:hypothetical protein [Candidatus Uhrbacteria bacterium]
MKKYIYLGFIVIAGLLLWTHDTHALTIQPVTLDELTLSPGESITKNIKLTNDGSSPVTVQPTFYQAEAALSEDGSASYTKATSESTLANWIVLKDGGQVTLQSKESKLVPLFISIPQDAPPGGHFAMIGWGIPSSVGDTGVGISGLTGVNVALDVRGQTVEKGEVTYFGTENGVTKFDKLPITFLARFNNGGNRHFKPQGDVKIKNMFGSIVTVLPFNNLPGTGNVLPRSNREYKVVWDSGFAFGKYTALFDVSMGGAGSASKTFTFWVLPTGLLVLWLIIALVIVVILVLLIKKMLESAGTIKK